MKGHGRRHTRKPKPDGEALRAAGLALPLCVLPEPQPRAVLPELPQPAPGWVGEAKPTPVYVQERGVLMEVVAVHADGTFDVRIVGPEPKTDDEAEMVEAERLWWVRRNDLPLMSDGPRDVRRGDRWLPHHFAPRGGGK